MMVTLQIVQVIMKPTMVVRPTAVQLQVYLSFLAGLVQLVALVEFLLLDNNR